MAQTLVKEPTKVPSEDVENKKVGRDNEKAGKGKIVGCGFELLRVLFGIATIIGYQFCMSLYEHLADVEKRSPRPTNLKNMDSATKVLVVYLVLALFTVLLELISILCLPREFPTSSQKRASSSLKTAKRWRRMLLPHLLAYVTMPGVSVMLALPITGGIEGAFELYGKILLLFAGLPLMHLWAHVMFCYYIHQAERFISDNWIEKNAIPLQVISVAAQNRKETGKECGSGDCGSCLAYCCISAICTDK